MPCLILRHIIYQFLAFEFDGIFFGHNNRVFTCRIQPELRQPDGYGPLAVKGKQIPIPFPWQLIFQSGIIDASKLLPVQKNQHIDWLWCV